MQRLGRRLRWQASSYSSQIDRAVPCRSRLAGEEARKSYSARADAFAGKPAPT